MNNTVANSYGDKPETPGHVCTFVHLVCAKKPVLFSSLHLWTHFCHCVCVCVVKSPDSSPDSPAGQTGELHPDKQTIIDELIRSRPSVRDSAHNAF